MADLIEAFKDALPTLTTEGRADMLLVVEKQIGMTRQNAQELAKNLGDFKPEYRELWISQIEKCRLYLCELDEVKKMLSKTS